jgi:hypothetical protein
MFKKVVEEFRTRYANGDISAIADCDRILGSPIRRIALRVLRSGYARTTLEERVLSEASRIRQTTPPGVEIERDSLSAMIARRVCRALVLNAIPGQTRSPKALDTVGHSTRCTMLMSN